LPPIRPTVSKSKPKIVIHKIQFSVMQQDLSNYPMMPENWDEQQYLKMTATVVFVFMGLTLLFYLLNRM